MRNYLGVEGDGLVIHHFEASNEFRTVEILCEKFHVRISYFPRQYSQP
jgi:hypothetical protein